ncbi:MAG: LamG domain-containing protein [Planctomycetes bacterium]|nr:LamG domain-containing protein [Planctomycetota bacterium]
MTSRSRTIIPALIGLFSSSAVLAQNVNAVETADYPPPAAPLDGLDGGAIWASPWLAGAPSHPLGLCSYWAFENDVLDGGPFAANGVLAGTYSTDVPALAPWSTMSLSLAGGADFVDLSAHVGQFAPCQMGAIACWIKTTGGGAHAILSASDTTEGSKEARLFLEGGLARFDVRGDLNSWTKNIGTNNDGRLLVSTTAVNDGLWHHVAVVIEQNGMGNLYIDGVLEDRGHQGFYRYVFDLDSMCIGRNVDSGGPQWPYIGEIDDLAFWGSPLTAVEVQALASGATLPLGVTGAIIPPDPLTAATPLDSAAYNTFGLQAEGGSIEATQGVRSCRLLASELDLTVTTTYYMSCLLRREDNINPFIEPAVVEFSDGGAIRGQFGWDATGTWVAGNEVPTLGAGAMAANTTYFCVFRIDAGAQETVYFKVYDPTDTVDASDAGLAGVGVGAGYWTAISAPYGSNAHMNQVWLTPTGPNKIVLDDLRFGSSWESVTHLAFGPSCGGLAIGRTGRPSLGGTYAVTLAGAPSAALCVLTLGLGNQSWSGLPLPFALSGIGGPAGCFLLTSSDVSVITFANAGGAASVSLSSPNNASLYGFTYYGQYGAFDGSLALPLPAYASDALEIVLQN